MSVAPEIVAAAHLGMKAFSVCAVSNLCDDGITVNYTVEETVQIHEAITSVTDKCTLALYNILEKFLPKIPSTN